MDLDTGRVPIDIAYILQKRTAYRDCGPCRNSHLMYEASGFALERFLSSSLTNCLGRTSPSVYMMVNTLTGDNSCGPLGPTYTNEVISMDLTDVYTLQPYADHTVTTRMGPPLPLTLSDLTSNCLNTYGTFSTDGAYINTHPVYGNYNRCHPRFVFPIELKRVG